VYTEKVLFIVLVQMHFIQRKQFSETNVTSHAFQQISDLKIFSKYFRGPLKTLWRATCCPRSCSWPRWSKILIYFENNPMLMKYKRAILLAPKKNKNVCNCICRKNTIHFQKQLVPVRVTESESQGVRDFCVEMAF